MRTIFDKKKEIILLSDENTSYNDIKMLLNIGYEVEYNHKTHIIIAIRYI